MLKDHLNKLEYFVSIVEAGSFLKGSETSFVSQPQLSKIVKQLEEVVGQKLLVRSRNGVKLTSAGQKLFDFSKTVVEGAKEFQFTMETVEEVSGKIRIGTYDSISRYFFPGFLKFLQSSAPKLEILLSAGKSHYMLEQLLAKKIDIAVIVNQGEDHPSLVTRSIYTDSFGLYAHPNINERFKKTLIAFPDSLAKEKKNLKTFSFKYTTECDNLETVKALAEQGIGVGILPHQVAKDGILKGKLVLLPETRAHFAPHEIIVAYRKEKLKKSSRLFIENLERFLSYWVLK